MPRDPNIPPDVRELPGEQALDARYRRRFNEGRISAPTPYVVLSARDFIYAMVTDWDGEEPIVRTTSIDTETYTVPLPDGSGGTIQAQCHFLLRGQT